MRPKIALFNAVAPLANKPHAACPRHNAARRAANQAKAESAGTRPGPALVSPQHAWQDPPRPPSASREAALDLADFVRHKIGATGASHLVGKHDFRSLGGILRGSGANLGRRLGLGERDLGFGLFGAP